MKEIFVNFFAEVDYIERDGKQTKEIASVKLTAILCEGENREETFDVFEGDVRSSLVTIMAWTYSFTRYPRFWSYHHNHLVRLRELFSSFSLVFPWDLYSEYSYITFDEYCCREGESRKVGTKNVETQLEHLSRVIKSRHKTATDVN